MVKINRLDNKIDELLSYDILIDGIEMLKINNNESKVIKLRSNNYSIQIIGKEFKSKIINFKVEDKNILFVCYPNHKNNLISRFIHKVLLKDGISLKIENS